MKVYDGPGLVADRACADLIPIRIDVTQYTPFTRLTRRVARSFAPQVTMTIRPSRKLSVDPAITARARRKLAGQQLCEVVSEMIFRTSVIDRTLSGALADAGSNGHVIVVRQPE